MIWIVTIEGLASRPVTPADIMCVRLPKLTFLTIKPRKMSTTTR